MKTKPIEIITLEADDGMMLTNGETYSKMVYLGVSDSPDNWREVTEEEAEEAVKNPMKEATEEASEGGD